MTRPSRVNDIVAPPSLGLASSSVTSWPAWARAVAAVMPASPPPITTAFTAVHGPLAVLPAVEAGQRLDRDQGLLAARQGHPALEHRVRVGRDPVKQAAVDARHRAGAGRAAAVDRGEQPQAGAVPLAGAGRLELHQVREPRLHGLGREGLGLAERGELDAELGQVLGRQVDAIVR